MSVGVQWLFLTAPLVGLQCVLVFFPNHNNLIFGSKTLSMVLIFSTSVYNFTEKIGANSDNKCKPDFDRIRLNIKYRQIALHM